MNPPTTDARRGHPRLALLVVLPAVLLIGAFVVAAPASPGPSARSTGFRDVGAPRVWALGRGPCCLAAVRGRLFVAEHRDPRLLEIDPVSGRVVHRYSTLGLVLDYGSLLSAGGYVWLTSGSIPALVRVDPVSHRRLEVKGVSNGSGTVFLNGSLWIGSQDDTVIRRVNPRAGELVGRITVKGTPGFYLDAAAGGSLWADTTPGVLLRIDPSSGKVLARLRLAGSSAEVRSVVGIGDAVWVAYDQGSVPAGSATVFRIDARTNAVTLRLTPTVKGNPNTFPAILSPGDGTVWLQVGPGQLTQLDPAAGTPMHTLPLPIGTARPATDYWMSSMLAAFGSYWVTSFPGQDGPSDPSRGFLYRLPRP